jgi:mitochondrial fission protein ELM1
MAERPLSVWVLSDGQPGHYNQSRGIIQALRRVRPVEVSWVNAELRLGLARNLLRGVLNRDQAPRSLWLLRLAYRFDALPGAGCDLIVSAGGKTSFANAWLASVLALPNLYAGSLRGLSARRFSVVLTLEPVPGAASNLVVPLPPSALNSDEVDGLGAAFRQQLGPPGQRYWTLLVGGDGAGYRYARADWLGLARLVNALAARHRIRWLLVSSRRTGRRAEDLLSEHVDAAWIARACWYRDGDEYQAEAWLGAAERIFVTEDSMTMLTEAASARRPVHSLWPETAAPEPRYEQALQRFAGQGWLCRHRIAELAHRVEALDEQPCQALAEAPTQWLADQLRERLGLG